MSEFPYHTKWILPAAEMFLNLKNYVPRPVYGQRYFMKSFYSPNKLFMPPKFRGQSVVLISSQPEFWLIEVLSSWYTEKVRLKTRRVGMMSPLEFWETEEGQQIAAANPDPKTCRDIIFDNTYEARQFRPTWVRGLIHLLYPYQSVQGLTMLDFSAGWGDRLLAAMAMNMNYIGYDPNLELKEGHDRMIADFGSVSRHRVIYKPFEDAVLGDQTVDVILTSPPFFNFEQYADDETQSIVRYPKFGQWMREFMIPSLKLSWAALRVGGYLVLHLGDTREGLVCELVQRYIEVFLPGASWEGVVGVAGGMNPEGKSTRYGPVWIWKKISDSSKCVRWNPTVGQDVRTATAVLEDLKNLP